MASRLKEEEKNEKAIRSLLRKASNRRCINCSSLGPQYVCLNFWTFVCTQCSGIHREFTHRVKSVSMSKFTSQEVTNLESGGNERAREIYFKDWDSQRQPLPDSSNVDRVRDFIKMVYVEKRFSGERPLPRGRGGDRDEVYDRRPEPRPNHHADSRSPSYDDRSDDRSQGGRRSNYGHEDRRYDDRGMRYDEKRSPGRFEPDRNRYDRGYNDNRRYEDRFRYDNRDRQYEDRLNEGLDRRFEERFSNERGSRDHGGSSPPPIRPVKEILGDDVPPLRVEDAVHLNGGIRDSDRSTRSQDGRGQRFGSSSSFGSFEAGTPPAAPVIKRENSASLIDFAPEPEVSREPMDPFGLTSASQPSASTSSSTGWATFDMFSPTGPVSVPAATPVVPASMPAPESTSGVTDVFNSLSLQTNGSAQWATQWPSMPAAPAPGLFESNADNWSSLVGPSNPPASAQPWSPFLVAPPPTAVNTSIPPHPQAGQGPQGANPAAVAASSQALPVQSSTRAEISEDLFAMPQLGVQFSGAPFGPSYGTQVGTFSQLPKSRNPFDFPGDTFSGPAAREFPNLGSLQAALPGSNTGPMHGPIMGGLGNHWNQPHNMPPPSSYHPAAPSASRMYGGQMIPNALPHVMQPPGGYPVGMGMPGSFLGPSPNQGPATFLIQTSPQLSSSQGPSGAGLETLFSHQGPAARVPLQTGPSGTDILFPGQQPIERLVSYGALGSLNSLSGTTSFFPAQPTIQGGHQGTGSFAGVSAPDLHFASRPPQFPQNTSNPFG